MPDNNSQMQGMMPAFMNNPQHQQQMQGLAMQVRQQEDGMKRTKKFLKAYEDIQLNQPIPPQQPAFMQPPGGQVQAQNQQLAASVAPEAAEAGPTSFTQMAGGMGGQQDMGMEDSSGPIPSAEPSAAGEGVPPGSPGDPGLSQQGFKASSGNTQAGRKFADTDMRIAGKDAAYDKVVKNTSWTGMPSWMAELKDWLHKAKVEVKIGKNTEASKVEMKVLQRTVKSVEADLKNAKKIDMDIAKKLKNIAASMPNKALGLGAAFGGSLMADAYAADAASNTPEMNAGRAVDQGAPGRNDNPRTSAAHQAFLELQAKTGNYAVNRKPGARGQEPIKYSAGEDVQNAQ